MKRAMAAAAASTALVLVCGCGGSTSRVTGAATGSGSLATESRPVQGFTGVAVSGAGHLIIEQTGVESLTITADENILPIIRSDVVGDQLILGFDQGASVTTANEVLYRLTVRDLNAIAASGASRVEAHGLGTHALATVFSGASSFNASGVADSHVMVLSGASRCDAPDLNSRNLIATLSGASSGLVRVSDSLAATASGGSILEFYGDPVVVTNVSGGSVVRHAGP